MCKVFVCIPKSVNQEKFERVLEGITLRRRQVLLKFLTGETDKAIAQSLSIEASTARKHIQEICNAFGLKNQPGERYPLRSELIKLFRSHKPELVSQATLELLPEVESPETVSGQHRTTTLVSHDYSSKPDPNFVGKEDAIGSPNKQEAEATTLIYVERPPIESVCYEKLLQPGSLIRLKATKGMGKTLLMNRIFAQVKFQGYQTVRLSLLRANEADIKNLDKFLRWFCIRVGRQLQPYHQVDNYEWDESLSSNDNCTAYLEECLLAKIDRPLVLGLDNIDRVFPHLAVAQDFFPLLRAWHEDGKFIETWKKLRLVVAYSTEVYIPLNIDQSPFNVGEEIELSEFSEEQVQDFAARHQLNWNTAQVQQLIDMVGGHPFLVQQALSHLRSHPDVTLEQLLQTAPTEAGIYRNHLREHLLHLQQHPELAIALKKVVTATSSVRLDSESTYKLHSMGLVNLQGNELTIQCNLYRQYFSERLGMV